MSQKRLPFQLEPLDKRFVPPKPQNSVENGKIIAVEKAGNAIFTRKRDGHYLTVVIKKNVRLYTRGIVKDVTANFPHIVNELRGLHLPKGGALFGSELIMDRGGKDCREYVARLTSRAAADAIALQEEQGRASLMVFNMLVLGGEDISSTQNAERIARVHELLRGREHVRPVEILNCTFEEAQQRVLKEKWEGLVVYDATKKSGYRLHGNESNPLRPDGCWKKKPAYEDDFIAYAWEPGTAGKRHEKRMGKIFLAQFDERGNRILCGEVGTGFSDEEREALANDSLYPCVVQVEYERRFPPRRVRSNAVQCALCNPRFVRLRDDKLPASCLLPQELLLQIRAK